MMRIVPLVIAFGVVLISGLSHALLTNRWGASEDVRLASERLAGVPTQVGDWVAQEEEMDPAEKAMAEFEGYRKLRFLNRTTGAEVQFLIVCGRPGPIAVHTPNICYLGAGFAMLESRKETFEPQEGGQPFEVEAGLFAKEESGLPIYQRTLWTFSAHGDWKVPDNPRFTYAREGALYKIYVVHQLARKNEELDKDPAVELLRLLIPQLQKPLFGPTPDS